MAQMHARGRGRRRHTAATDLRGPAGRARALRAALANGWDPDALAAALAAGDPFASQLALPLGGVPSTGVTGTEAGAGCGSPGR
jgi:hypothetical protein